MLRELQPQAARPCVRCGAPATAELWSRPACAGCFAVWMGSKRTLVGEVDAAIGVTWVHGVPHAKGVALTSAEYLAASSEVFRRLADEWARSKRGAA